MDHLHAVRQLTITTLHTVGPQSETSEVGCDTWHLECYSLQRSIAPRLIVRRIDTQVIAQYQIVICHIEDAVIASKIARQEDQFHLVLLLVPHIVVFQHAQHVVMTHVVEPVSNHRHLQRCVERHVQSQSLLQVLTRVAHPSRNLDECHHRLCQFTVAQQSVHRLYIYVNTLVTELISSAGRHYHGLIVKTGAEQSVSNLQQALSCSLTFLRELCTLWHEIILKTIWQHHVDRLVQQLLAFVGSYLAHRRKAVSIVSRLFFYRVFALHVQLLSHLVAIIGKEIVVEWFVVACYRASYARSVSSEYGSNTWNILLQVQHSETSHPLISLIYHLLLIETEELVVALHHLCRSV